MGVLLQQFPSEEEKDMNLGDREGYDCVCRASNKRTDEDVSGDICMLQRTEKIWLCD